MPASSRMKAEVGVRQVEPADRDQPGEHGHQQAVSAERQRRTPAVASDRPEQRPSVEAWLRIPWDPRVMIQ
jgi:hypothetical protein